MFESYDDAIGHEVTRAQALAELRAHGIDDPREFLAEVGDFETYLATSVLDWLGY